jgi:hypothetical protein
MAKDIVSITRTTRYKRYPGEGNYVDGRNQTGVDLRMIDGSLWFHPDEGSDPRQIEPAEENAPGCNQIDPHVLTKYQ